MKHFHLITSLVATLVLMFGFLSTALFVWAKGELQVALERNSSLRWYQLEYRSFSISSQHGIQFIFALHVPGIASRSKPGTDFREGDAALDTWDMY